LVLPNTDISLNANVEGQVISQQPILVSLSDGTNLVTPVSSALVGNSLGITILPTFSNFDPDYRKVLLTAQGNGITLPSASQRILQNQYMIQIKSIGQYNLADLLYVFAHDAPISFGCINWKNPLEFNMTMYNAMTQIVNQGVKGDGISAYGSTNYTPITNGINYTLNNASRYYYLYNSIVQPNNFIDGSLSTTVSRMILTNSLNSNINGGNLTTLYDFTLNKEMKSIHRVDSANINLFRNKNITSQANNSSVLLGGPQFINRAGNQFSQNTCSMYMMGANMTSINDDVVDEFDAYLNAL
jgi:hypothetical protein